MERPLRVVGAAGMIVGGPNFGDGMEAGGRTGGNGESGGGVLTGGGDKSQDTSNSDVAGSSHSCMKTGGRLTAGCEKEVLCGGKAMLLSTKSTTEGGAEATRALIFQTEQKFASVLQVENSSS